MSWILLHRQIKENWIWSNPEKFKWWLDILLSVNHTDNKVLIKSTLIDCGRGQSIKSLETWAKEWGVTKKTVHGFFKLLESDSMLVTENLLVTTRITVCNYDSYNDPKELAQMKKETQRTPQRKRDLPTNKEGINNTNTIVLVFDEKQKSEFEKFAEWIETHAPDLNRLKEPISIQQYWKLREHYKKIEITNMCEKMHNNANLTKKYKSAYITLKNWLKNETK